MTLNLRLFLLLASFLWVVILGQEEQDVRLPPSIVEGPDKTSHDFIDDGKYVLKCVASGIPTPTYEWQKDGDQIVGFGGKIKQLGDGTIEINELGILDEGTYECRASNAYGVALAHKIVLRRAVLAHYLAKPVYEPEPEIEGTPFNISCQPTKCYPKPIFSWGFVGTPEDLVETPLHPDKRIQIDEDGNLHFSYLISADEQNGRLYKCKLFNNIMDVMIGGSYTLLRVTPVATVASFAPKKLFSSNSSLVGLEGHDITLRCFFSGKPDPLISWSKANASLPIGRYSVRNFNTELTLSNLQPSDQGRYHCNAQNPEDQNVRGNIDVRIEAIPVFLDLLSQPVDVNVTEGSDVVMNCKAHAKPTATVVWMRNGEILDLENLPRKFRLSPDGETLTISNVCKTCPDGVTSDLMVIQCTATNIHGYTLADGYINVIHKTELTLLPENITLSVEEETGDFFIDAKTDDLTPLTMRWFQLHGDGSRQLLYPDLPYVKILDGGRQIGFYLPHNATQRKRYNGRYEAVVNNSYSWVRVEVFLEAEEIPPPLQTPGPVLAGIAELWWIIAIVVGIFLLFLLLLICCICCYRNRGDVYPVDKKERKSGRDPVKELADSGFFDYRRPEAEPVKGSRASLNSSISMSDEEASLNEYGDVDAGKFTEEGSFVGDYVNVKPSGKNHRNKDSKA